MTLAEVRFQISAEPESEDLHGFPLEQRKQTPEGRIPFPQMAPLVILIILLTVLTGRAVAGTEPYEYPYSDPYVATVIGTPKDLRAKVPQRIPVSERELTVFEGRPVPDILWYSKRLRYSVALQDRAAPLIFLIPGMGAGHSDQRIEFLQKAFFQEGFHVVCLPSTTHPNFIAAASKSGIPGNPREDARDLYRVMELVIRDLREDVAISGFHLAGYSLGAVHAAFLADMDRERDLFRFGKVLLINPPLSLYSSMRILDGLIKKIPGGEERFGQFFDEAFRAFSAVHQLNEPVNFTGDFLYRGRHPEEENLEALIGLSFRLSMANMVFTTDVFSNAGYIKPKNLRLSTTDSLTKYFKVADLVTFSDYFRDILIPYLAGQTPGLTERQLIEQMSLESIEPFLGASPSVILFHNVDDVTLAPGEVDLLRRMFGSRARIYPRGGHCGNLMYEMNVSDMLAAFKEEEVPAGGATETERSGPAPTAQTLGPPPVLTMNIAPARPESEEAARPSYTAPRSVAACMGEVSKEKDRTFSAAPETGIGTESEIVAARHPFSQEATPGLSYVIDVLDPFEPVNRALYRFNAVLDEYLFLPVTRAYEFITPYFVQDRISGIFSNISDIRSLGNAILQLRPVRTGKILTRFLINTTLGLAGMWDPATSLGFPRHVEDFGQTLGRYGIGPGPFMVLPVFGPSSLRDTSGLAADAAAQYFYLYMPTDMDKNREWGGTYVSTNAVDQRHNIPFRYYQTGSPFEYDLLRLLYKKKRELDIEQ